MKQSSDGTPAAIMAPFSSPGPVPALASIDGQSLALKLIDSYAQPAWLVDASGIVAAVNSGASNLRIQGLITDLAAETRLADRSLTRRVTVAESARHDRLSLELTAIPLGNDNELASDGDSVILILARDVTLDHDLTTALVESREMYRDLLQCSGDFAWEANTAGEFTYISVRSALGFNANDLLGRSAASLLSTDRPQPDIMPFSVRKPVEHASCWMLAVDGEERCLSLNAIPMFDDHGNWLGARGVCRDITAEVSQRTAFTRLTEREKLVDGVIEAMRNAPEPSSMLAMAVREMATAVKYAVTLLRRNAKGHWYAADGAPIPEKSLLAESLGRLIDERGSDNVFEHEADCGRYLCRAIKVGPVVNGALIFFRAHPVTAFPSTAATLVDALIGPLGIAIAQADHIERLQQLSSIDELTGLLNRRAFIDAANQRLAMGRRQKRQAVFLYLDLDHFKPINDRLGHQAGDKLLRQVGQLLHNSTRANDLAVRLGGDEFGLWLDAADIGGAITKGEVLLQAVPLLSPDMAVPGSKLGLSIGIAEISYGNDETIIDILSRADAALYNAKRAGRGRWYVAPPPEQKT